MMNNKRNTYAIIKKRFFIFIIYSDNEKELKRIFFKIYWIYVLC